LTEKMNMVRLVAIALVGLVLLAAPRPAFSQSCALCYTQAASSGARMISALRSGIWILVIPPMFMSIGITVLAYRKRNQFRDAERTAESDRIV
jgi:CHASE2 domain-containing sensor protein